MQLSKFIVASLLGITISGCSQPDSGEIARLEKELKSAKEEASAAKAELAKLQESAKAASSFVIPSSVLASGGPPPAAIPTSEPSPTPAAVTPSPAPAPLPAEAGNDAELIQGDWVTSAGSSFVEGVAVIIAGNKDLGYFISIGSDRYTYSIDPTKTPKTIDITSARDKVTMQGIYELKGGILTMAVLLNGSTRPDNYAMSAEDTANDKAGKSSKWVFLLSRQRR